MATANKTRDSRAAKMRDYFTANPKATVSAVAKKFKTTYQIAYMTKKNMEENAVKDADRMYEISKGRREQRWKTLELLGSDTSIKEAITMTEPVADPVNHPAHYKVGGIETIDFIEAKSLGYNLGNVVKYVTRSDHKDNRLQDLEKARWYLDREIGNLSEKLATQNI
jgi:D-alanyl-D-alanine carboxypeptidase